MHDAASALLQAVHPLTGAATDYDSLLRLVGDAHIVLIGEATYGTHEFCSARSEITKRLIHDLGFNAVAVEGDWADAWPVNRFVRGESDDETAGEALRHFDRFPQWMWRNADVVDFAGWLRESNDALPLNAQKAGFYGLDLYSVNASVQTVLHYLDRVDPGAAARARRRYASFDHFSAEECGMTAGVGISGTCERELVAQLMAGNPRLARHAETYYHAMFGGRTNAWNVRDIHMTETLHSLQKDLSLSGRKAKIVVWAHNSHAGDARATEMGHSGLLSMGQLARQRWRADVVLIGSTTHGGTVMTASSWDAPTERRTVRPALSNSYEALFYDVDCPAFFITLRDKAAILALDDPRLERAIGVVYLPAAERQSHYCYARLAHQFDAVIHFDATRAVEPMPSSSRSDVTEGIPREAPVTYS